MKPFKHMALATIALLAFATPALAFDWISDVHVNAVEATYMPDNITFWVDGGAGSCPVSSGLGSQLHWHGHAVTAGEEAANVQAVYSLLLTAKATGRTVRLFGRNSDCEVEFIYLM